MQKTIIPLMGAVAISNIMYTALHSFYPIYIDTHYPTLTTIHFSIILACFEVANLATSLILGMYMGRIKRKNLIISSNLLLLLSTLCFSLLPLLQGDSSEFPQLLNFGGYSPSD
jgi:MFS family permease